MTTVAIPERIMMNKDVKKHVVHFGFHWQWPLRQRYTGSLNKKCNVA